MMSDPLEIKAGDTWPPLQLADEICPIDLGDAVAVRICVDGKPYEDVTVIDPGRGLIERPKLEVGDHVIQYEIEWPLNLVQYAPTAPRRVHVRSKLKEN